MTPLYPLIAAAVVVCVWLMTGVLSEVRTRLSRRFGSWLLPDSQAATFRIAVGILKTAHIIAPSHRVRYSTRTGVVTSPRAVPLQTEAEWSISSAPTAHAGTLLRTETEWWTSSAALRELEADLAADKRVLDPVRLVLPLLIQGVSLRLANGKQRAIAVISLILRWTKDFVIMLATAVGTVIAVVVAVLFVLSACLTLFMSLISRAIDFIWYGSD